MKMFDMRTMEEVSSVIRLWFCLFLYEHLLRFEYDLECGSLSVPTYFFISMSEFLVVDRVRRSCDCTLGRVEPLVRRFILVMEDLVCCLR